MLNIPDAIKTLYQQDSVRKNFRVKFPNGEMPDITNSNVLTESVTFTESLCSQQYLKFGLTEASEIQFETIGIGNMLGMTIECYSEIDTTSLTAAQIADIQAMTGLDGELVLAADSDLTNYDGTTWGFYRVPYGTFVVDECPRSHGAMTHRRVTAYTNKPDEVIDFAQFLTGPFYGKELYINFNLFRSLADSSLLTKTDKTIDYNASGSFSHNFLSQNRQRMYRLTIHCPLYNVQQGAFFNSDTDLFKMDYVLSDADQYASVGTYIAQAISNLGYDIRYRRTGNSATTRIYKTNEESLRYAIPGLFTPSVNNIYFQNQAIQHTSEKYNIPVSPGKMMIVPNGQSGIYSDAPSTYPNYGYFDGGAFRAMGGPPTQITFEELSADGQTIYNSYDIPLNSADFTLTIDGYSVYSINTLSDYWVKIVQTNTQKNFFPEIWTTTSSGGTTTYHYQTYPGYSYIDTIDIVKVLNAQMELSASFGVPARDGTYKSKTLSATVDETLDASLYSELWWDEYDIDAVGNIQYSYNNEDDEKSTTVYQFGTGESVYEMKDNHVLLEHQIYKTSYDTGGSPVALTRIVLNEDGVSEILGSTFLSGMELITFTPIELDSIGLPYIEAGDLLTIETGAEDVPTVSSYVMRHTIKGIQALTDTIESTSGELMTAEDIEDE